jgi:hypothetical protein
MTVSVPEAAAVVRVKIEGRNGPCVKSSSPLPLCFVWGARPTYPLILQGGTKLERLADSRAMILDRVSNGVAIREYWRSAIEVAPAGSNPAFPKSSLVSGEVFSFCSHDRDLGRGVPAFRLGWRVKAHCLQFGPMAKSGHGRRTAVCRTIVDLDIQTLVWTRGDALPLDLWRAV